MKIFKIKFDSKMPTTRKVTVGKDDDFGLAIQIDGLQTQGPAKLLYAGQEVEANKDLIEGYNVFLLKAVKDSTIAIKDIDSQVTFQVDISIKNTDVVELGGAGGGDAVWEYDGNVTFSIPNVLSVNSCDGIIAAGTNDISLTNKKGNSILAAGDGTANVRGSYSLQFSAGNYIMVNSPAIIGYQNGCVYNIGWRDNALNINSEGSLCLTSHGYSLKSPVVSVDLGIGGCFGVLKALSDNVTLGGECIMQTDVKGYNVKVSADNSISTFTNGTTTIQSNNDLQIIHGCFYQPVFKAQGCTVTIGDSSKSTVVNGSDINVCTTSGGITLNATGSSGLCMNTNCITMKYGCGWQVFRATPNDNCIYVGNCNKNLELDASRIYAYVPGGAVDIYASNFNIGTCNTYFSDCNNFHSTYAIGTTGYCGTSFQYINYPISGTINVTYNSMQHAFKTKALAIVLSAIQDVFLNGQGETDFSVGQTETIAFNKLSALFKNALCTL